MVGEFLNRNLVEVDCITPSPKVHAPLFQRSEIKLLHVSGPSESKTQKMLRLNSTRGNEGKHKLLKDGLG